MKVDMAMKFLQTERKCFCKPSFKIRPHVYYFQSRSLSLAYALHPVSDHESKRRQNDVIFLHGLFGSKANNKTISQ